MILHHIQTTLHLNKKNVYNAYIFVDTKIFFIIISVCSCIEVISQFCVSVPVP